MLVYGLASPTSCFRFLSYLSGKFGTRGYLQLLKASLDAPNDRRYFQS